VSAAIEAMWFALPRKAIKVSFVFECIAAITNEVQLHSPVVL